MLRPTWRVLVDLLSSVQPRLMDGFMDCRARCSHDALILNIGKSASGQSVGSMRQVVVFVLLYTISFSGEAGTFEQ